MFRLIISIFFCIPLCALAAPITFTPEDTLESQASTKILPDNYPVYTNGLTVINHPASGFSQLVLPTNNDYQGKIGCYIMCYSHDKLHSVYPIAKNIFVNGLIRVPGKYNHRICIPNGYENKDLSADASFNKLCHIKIMTCNNNQCWAGGDTGGWFGIE